MKRLRSLVLILIITILPAGIIYGQEKKSEQKIKVVVSGEKGTQVVIDTTFINSEAPDSIITKDGDVIFITRRDAEPVVATGKKYKVITSSAKGGKHSQSNYVYITDDMSSDDRRAESFDIIVKDTQGDSFDNDSDKSRYVIARNGVTVTIEGKDEAKVKELADKIRKDLGNEENKKEKEE